MASRPCLSPAAYSVAWISALPIESAAAEALLDERHDDPRSDNVSMQYTFGKIGKHNVVLAHLPSGQMGTNSAATVAGRLTTAFPSIKFGFMVGIGGGVPTVHNDIRLGDVVIGHPHLQHGGVVQYDFGKTNPKGQIDRIGALNAPPTIILNAIGTMRTNYYLSENSVATHLSVFEALPQFNQCTTEDVLYRSTYSHDGGETCDSCDKTMIVQRSKRASKEPVIHYGTIASGNQVMKDGVARDDISTALGGVMCFEMEGAGLANTIPSVVIRGVCDYADSHKNKSWQPFAASTAAAVAKELLLLVPAEEAVGAVVTKGSTNYRIPFSLKGVPVGRFADRPDDMKKLERELMPDASSSDRRRKVLILHGLGGIGKTQLAVEFARKHHPRFTSVFWLDGSSEENIKQSITDCVGRLPEDEETEPGDAIRKFMSWLSIIDNTDWLLIIDNIDRSYQQPEIDPHAYDVQKYIPGADHGSVLITSRLTNLGQLGNSIHLGSVSFTQAQLVFQKWYDQGFDPSSADCKELFQLLDGLPLALTQAAAYMNETGADFKTYVRIYKEHWKRLMETTDTVSLVYGDRSIGTTWLVSYDAIRAKSTAAANLLLLWAHFDNKSLPYWIFETASTESEMLNHKLSTLLEHGVDNEAQFLGLVRLLRSYCLAESGQGGVGYSTHPVVHQWAYHIQDERMRADLSQLVLLMIGSIRQDEHGENYPWMQRQLLPHIEFLTEKMSLDGKILERETSYDISKAIYVLGRFHYFQGNMEKAEKMFSDAREGSNKLTGNGKTLNLRSSISLGYVYILQGRLEEAEIIHQSLFQDSKASEADPEMLAIMKGLAFLYAGQGKFEEAEQMFHRTLDIQKGTLGPYDPSTLTTANGLAGFYLHNLKLEEAQKTFEFVLRGREKAMPANHPRITDTLHGLGMVYNRQGTLKEAEDVFKRAVTGREHVMGEDNTETMTTVFNLGLVYHRQGRLDEAEKVFNRVIDSKCSVASAALFNLGAVYVEQGKLDEAETAFREVLQANEEILGHDHVETLDTIKKIGQIYKLRNQLDEFSQMCELVKRRTARLVERNGETPTVAYVDATFDHVLFLEDQGRLEEAKTVYKGLWNDYAEKFGSESYRCRAIQDRLAVLDGDPPRDVTPQPLVGIEDIVPTIWPQQQMEELVYPEPPYPEPQPLPRNVDQANSMLERFRLWRRKREARKSMK